MIKWLKSFFKRESRFKVRLEIAPSLSCINDVDADMYKGLLQGYPIRFPRRYVINSLIEKHLSADVEKMSFIEFSWKGMMDRDGLIILEFDFISCEK